MADVLRTYNTSNAYNESSTCVLSCANALLLVWHRSAAAPRNQNKQGTTKQTSAASTASRPLQLPMRC